MTTRERWLLAGLILVAALLPVLGIWQQVRYRNAERAVQEFIQLDDRSRGGEATQVALIRQARPEIRHSLSRGDFSAALQRLSALQAEDTDPADSKKTGKSIAVDKLWPPNSRERKQAQQVLRQLVQKQSQGYDMAAAHGALVRVADAARAGKRKEALSAFKDVGLLVREAPLRAGFKGRASRPGLTPAALPGKPGARPAMPGGRGGKPVPPMISPVQMQQIEQFFQLVLPQLIQRANPEQRAMLERLQPFGAELSVAYRQGKDIRPVLVLLQKLGPAAMRGGDPRAAEALLAQAQALLRAAKPLPRGAAPVGVVPLGGKTPLLKPGPGLMPAVPRPSAPMGRGGPGQVSPERILQALDMIRKLPEPVYRQQRSQIGMFIGQAIAGGAGLAAPAGRMGFGNRHSGPLAAHASPSPPGNGAHEPGGAASAVTLGTASALRLDFGPHAEILRVSALGRDLSQESAPGGFSVALPTGGEAALLGPLKGNGRALAGMLSGAGDVTCAVSYQQDGRDATVHSQVRRTRPGTAGALLLRIPLRAAGWHWDAGDGAQVVAVDGRYIASSSDGGKLNLVTLRGADVRLAVSAPDASSISYDAAAGFLIVKLAVPAAGTADHTVQLTVSH